MDGDEVSEVVEMTRRSQFDFQSQICAYFDECGSFEARPAEVLSGLAFLFINFPESVPIEVRLFENVHSVENLKKSLLQRNSHMPFKTMISTVHYKQLVKNPEDFDVRKLDIVSAEQDLPELLVEQPQEELRKDRYTEQELQEFREQARAFNQRQVAVFEQVGKIVSEFQAQIDELFASFRENAELKLADMRDHFNSVFRFYNNLIQQTKKRQNAIEQRKEYEKQRICKLLTRKCKVPLE